MSKFFQWSKPDYTVSVDKMDDEHEQLIGIMNRLFDRNEAGASKVELKNILQELADYTTMHFQNEEAFMESIDYPKLAVHKNIHKHLLTKFGELMAAFNKGPEQTLDNELFRFLKFWLQSHIKGIDRQYGDYQADLRKTA